MSSAACIIGRNVLLVSIDVSGTAGDIAAVDFVSTALSYAASFDSYHLYFSVKLKSMFLDLSSLGCV